MDTILSSLQFRTAMPFGYLFFFFIWIVWMSVCAVILFRCIHLRRVASAGFLVSTAGLCLGALILYANIVFPERLDFNPLFSEEELFGSWEQGGSVFEIEIGGAAAFSLEPELRNRIGVLNGEGHWKRSGDFGISIGNQTITQTAILRAIRYRDELRIIIQDYKEADMWDGNLGFRKSPD